MGVPQIINHNSEEYDNGIGKSDSSSITDVTSSPSDNDTASTSAIDDDASLSESKKSVRFSIVHVREYNVVDELPPPDDVENDSEGPVRRKSLGWEYTEKESDLETHQEQARQQRKEKYLSMIQDHIIRAEREREEREINEMMKKKKKGFKSKVMKPIWKGFLEAANRSSMVIPTHI